MENHYDPGDDAPPVSILGRLQKGIKKDNPTKILTVYLGLSLVIVFLTAVSLAPQLSQNLGSLQARKQAQQSQAAVASQVKLTADFVRPYAGQRVGISWQSPYTKCYLTQSPRDPASPWTGQVAGRGFLTVVPMQTTTYYFSAVCGNQIISDRNVLTINVVAPLPAPPQAKVSPCYPAGDVNNDYYVNSKDADLVLAIVAKLPLPVNLPANYLVRADIDGKAGISATDALEINKFLSSTNTNYKFPVCSSLQYPL